MKKPMENSLWRYKTLELRHLWCIIICNPPVYASILSPRQSVATSPPPPSDGLFITVSVSAEQMQDHCCLL